MKIQQAETTKYQINTSGAIEIKSIKDPSIFETAKKFDSDNNNVLENAEIAGFIDEISFQNNNEYKVYYSSYDSNGNLRKKSVIMESDNTQITYFYKDGKAIQCTATKANGEMHLIGLKYGKVILYPDKDNISGTKYEYDLTKRNLNYFRRVGEGKPVGFENVFEELFYRITNWDWE